MIGWICEESLLKFVSIAKDNKWILAPKSSKTLSTDKTLMSTKILKLLGSLDFEGKLFWIITLQPTSNFIVFSSMKLLFFVSNSFMNFANVGICSKPFTNGILICKFLKICLSLANCLSLYFLEGAWGYDKSLNGTPLSLFSIFFSFFLLLYFFFFFIFSFSFKLSFFSSSFLSFLTSSSTKLSPILSLTTIPLLVVIELQCSLSLCVIWKLTTLWLCQLFSNLSHLCF